MHWVENNVHLYSKIVLNFRESWVGRRYAHVRWWVEVVSSRTGAGWEVQIVVELYIIYISKIWAYFLIYLLNSKIWNAINWLYKMKLSFHQYKLFISFSETKRSHADEHIPLPPHTDRFPHRGMDYQILVTI